MPPVTSIGKINIFYFFKISWPFLLTTNNTVLKNLPDFGVPDHATESLPSFPSTLRTSSFAASLHYLLLNTKRHILKQ